MTPKYTCPKCHKRLKEQDETRLTPKLIKLTLKCPACPYSIEVTRPTPKASA